MLRSKILGRFLKSPSCFRVTPARAALFLGSRSSLSASVSLSLSTCFSVSSSSSLSSSMIEAKSIVYKERGALEDVLEIETSSINLDEIQSDQIVVKYLASPLNPADFNMIQGNYSLLPDLPAVGGNEGVAEVIAKGSDVHSLEIGDRVIPARAGAGTWRTHGVSRAGEFDRIPEHLSLIDAATIAINPCTAYRMLTDFVSLEKNDIVVQNGATSAVGRAVIQLCKSMGVRSVNFIRPRDDADQMNQTVRELKALGADYVYAEGTKVRQIRQEAPELNLRSDCKLALNCVGGLSSLSLSSLLRDQGTMVTYGGMSKRPVQIPTGKHIFNDIISRGFWLTRWVQQHSSQERMQMINDISELIRREDFSSVGQTKDFELQDFINAIHSANTGKSNKKTIFRMDTE